MYQVITTEIDAPEAQALSSPKLHIARGVLKP